MKTVTAGTVQKNFADVLRHVAAGEEFIVTKRGRPVARIIPANDAREINWPNFEEELVAIKGKSLSGAIIEDRKDRF
ncbi:MAG: type II toxin-antitoxin system prevent-host-death family antitoxin [Thermodesulfobacteriota bacterium]|nr:type II toxin-antitoxin system prevent-host-death family antitoxin [Thermodesulfobacteriota bacterium]